MTDDEARCYIDRYPDLHSFDKDPAPEADAVARAKKHYADFGQFEGRNFKCAAMITDQ